MIKKERPNGQETAKGSTGPVGGLRVLDLTEERGLYAGKVLADLGADVVLVERPEGSRARSLGPFKDDNPGIENSLYFLNFNTNKRGITLNLDSSRGRDLFIRLATGCDVVVEDYPIGRMHSLGLDYSALCEKNPGIIMASVTGFGSSGPYARYKAPDIVGVAMGGLTYVNGPTDAAPVTAPCEQAYHSVSVTAVFGILAALLLRTKTGKGQSIELSAQRAVATITGGVWQFGAMTNIAKRSGSQFGAVPGRIFPCKDGYVHILTIRPNHWLGFLEVIGNPEALRGDKWLVMEFRNANADIIDAYVTEFTMAHGKMEIAEICQAKGVPCAPVDEPADLYRDAHIRQRGTFTEIEHPVAGRFPVVRPVPVFSRTKCRIVRPAPLLGQHNREVFCEELGTTGVELAQLKAEGVV
jgi:crotonobetainyl-CoA:carnitine CoA-transferase CaiB-like acyl-CoA transferase